MPSGQKYELLDAHVSICLNKAAICLSRLIQLKDGDEVKMSVDLGPGEILPGLQTAVFSFSEDVCPHCRKRTQALSCFSL